MLAGDVFPRALPLSTKTYGSFHMKSTRSKLQGCACRISHITKKYHNETLTTRVLDNHSISEPHTSIIMMNDDDDPHHTS